ncbi:CubicO group peptidase, beta-lactamase class C family [Sinosporangium album]|uniref:CubicO group peptidase, beta-lactamase class C family n=1 Tax=Sinosporangium album TaxID=504805 RepID=A0A1G8JIZ4_9ACTN|nr:serine hydrolase domain-containing protein [Sinosporangium album]SDI31185.1 CubicO group peptidase, beta-lactamase class C family [Sinosporangium album]
MTLSELQKTLDEAVKARGVPGATLAVYADGELHEAAAGVLNVETGVEATPDSVHQVGSTTKVWTAALIMQLVDEGLVDLDKPVRAYLPEFTLADEEAAARVTVRHLLTHTGGFVGDIFTDTGRGDDCVDIYVKSLSIAGQIDEPGSTFSYCNSGYVVLGAIVARLRGCTWEQALREHLAEPLGCTQVAVLPEEAVLFRAAAGHGGPPDKPQVVRPWLAPRSNGPAGSTLCLAPRELVRFGRMLLAGGVAEDGTRVLSEESVRAMVTPQVDVPYFPGFPSAWGLGVELHGWGGGAYGHDGGTPGQSTTWWIAPERGVVLALAVNGGDVMGLLDDVVTPLARDVAGLTRPVTPKPPAEPEVVDTAPYVGSYAAPILRYDVVDAGGGALQVSTAPGELPGLEEMPTSTKRYVALSEHVFIAVEGEGAHHEVLSFIMDGGKATHVFLSRALPRV